MNAWVTQLRRGLIEFCVLNVLRHGPGYGYQIVQALQVIEPLAVSESTVYPILTRLREEGLLTVRDVPSPAGPPRRYFSLTVPGRLRLAEMSSYWESLEQSIDALRRLPPPNKERAT